MAKKQLDFKSMEDKWKKFWIDNTIYKVDLRAKKIYTVDTPPPYLSGKMHLGHAFSYSQQDFLIRFRRMFDGSVYYPFGTDDNGLPTERYVEKLHKLKSQSMSRAKFVDLCLKTLKEMRQGFIQDWQDIGCSCDYDAYYSTIDKNSQKISQKSFVDLYKQGDLYKKEFPTLWCPECQTSIAQAELEDKECFTFFTTLKFKAEGKNLLIATTRPELLGACVAVFVNPKDKRYKNIVGKRAKVPLFDQEVPILEDESADPEKGTGVLMVCSYGDKYDVEAINRHKLSPKIILNSNGTLNIGKYKGLKIKEARKKILEDLEKKGLVKEQKQIDHVVNVHDRCSTEIEFIQTDQWFIKIIEYKKKLIEQGKKVKWYPKFMYKRYENWVNGLEWDWSISRERHFGVPIPVWECGECNEIILPKENELPVDPLQTKKKCPKCGKDAVGEQRVLDTWMTSSMTPQIAASLIDNKVKIPFSLRPQAHDIIRTWAFYTIVKSYLHQKEIPWKDIAISGHITMKGEKMSKSKGNVIVPKDVLDEYGADAMRFAAANAKLGNDSDYYDKDLITGKKFLNKLINASKFVFMNLEDYDKKSKPKNLELVDQLFSIKLGILVQKVTDYFMKYEYSKAKQEVEQFFWHDFCDNYLEIVKKRVYNGEGDKKLSAQHTLYQSLSTIIKMIAPIMPFVTEEIYQEQFKEEKSIHISSWPEVKKIGKKALDQVKIYEKLIRVLEEVRKTKTKEQKPMNSEIILTLEKQDKRILEGVLDDLKAVTNSKEIKEGKFSVEFV